MARIAIWEMMVSQLGINTRAEATAWILAGKVFHNSEKITSPGQLVSNQGTLLVKGIEQKYVNKGGLKLEGAICDFCVNVCNRVAIDAGASTGGFTDCLLQYGAKQVYAVDVGYGQLAGKLRIHPNVVNLERVNISDLRQDAFETVPSLATLDLSYLSLRNALPIVSKLISIDAEIICLVKPLFEVNDSGMRRTGVICDEKIYSDILCGLVEFVNSIGMAVLGVTNSKVTGNKGTKEFFIYISMVKDDMRKIDYEECRVKIDSAITNVRMLDDYKK